MSEEGLKQKTVKGVAWTTADTILRYGVTFIVGIVLARLLSPDEYGLIGILTVYIAVFEIIIDGGFSYALIRKKNAQEVDYSTVFYANMFVSILMAAVIYFSAGIVADFFERQELVPLTQVMSVIVVINALSLVPKARLSKNIDFKTQTIASVVAAIVSGLLGIGMAYKGYGVWSLVGQQISGAAITTLYLIVATKWIPILRFSWKSFKEMWSFGWKLLLSGIFNTISGQLHSIVIGKCFSPATLGHYTRAFQFGSLFSGNLTSVIQRVTFPVLSAIQDDPVYLKEAYKRVIKVTVLPTFILMMCLAACAQPFIVVLIGEKWLEASYYLQILCFSMMLFPLHALNLNAIQVMGRSDLTLRINIIKNLLMAIPIVIGIMTNIYWMLVADVVRNIICYYLNAYYSKPLLNYPISEQIKDIVPHILISIVIAIPIYFVSFIPLSPILLLLIQVLMGTVIGLVILEKTKLPEYLELRGIVLNVVNHKIRVRTRQ